MSSPLEKVAFRARWLLAAWLLAVWLHFLYQVAGTKGHTFVQKVCEWFP